MTDQDYIIRGAHSVLYETRRELCLKAREIYEASGLPTDEQCKELHELIQKIEDAVTVINKT